MKTNYNFLTEIAGNICFRNANHHFVRHNLMIRPVLVFVLTNHYLINTFTSPVCRRYLGYIVVFIENPYAALKKLTYLCQETILPYKTNS